MVEVKNKGHESEVSYLMWMVSGGAGVAVTGSPQMDCYWGSLAERSDITGCAKRDVAITEQCPSTCTYGQQFYFPEGRRSHEWCC